MIDTGISPVCHPTRSGWFGEVGYHPVGFAPILLRLAVGLPHVLVYTV
jgi:hypothetical protein